MRKLFFASALVAGMGMLGSCSNDDVAVTNGTPGVGNGNGLVPVELALNGPSVTVEKRGIGTVGDIEGEEANKWQGEKLYLLMMQRSKSNKAQTNPWGFTTWTYQSAAASGEEDPNIDDSDYDGTTPEHTNPTATIVNFPNVKVTAPTNVASGALSWTEEQSPKYYPDEGIHDFFAYNIDNAATIYTNPNWKMNKTDASANADFMVRDSLVEGQVKMKYVWFKIDGSQDLMTGVATNEGEEDEAGKNLGFSAQTARAGIKPAINMQHLLTRFTFTVQAAAESAVGLKVTNIAVKSKTTGKMIVAYDLADGVFKPEKMLEWTLPVGSEPTTEEPVKLDLKSRTGANTDVTALEAVTIQEGTGSPDKTYEKQPIGHALMVAPGESEYTMYITIEQTFEENDPDHDAVGSVTLEKAIDLTKGGTAEGAIAEAGSSYAVNVKVYGMAKVEVDATLTGWKDGGDLEVDTNVN